MKNIGIKLAAVALLAVAPSVAFAGRGGSAEAIQTAVRSTSVDAIIAEVERTEGLVCESCIQVMTSLTEDSRFAVREAAGWWFGKRPALRDMLVPQFTDDLARGNTISVRNAADFLGASKTFRALPQLCAASQRSDIGAEAKLALVRAVGFMAIPDGNPVLTTAMRDGDARVRAAAVAAWRDMLDQQNAQPVVPLLADSDASVRAQAAAVVGGLGEQGARAALEALVVSDSDAIVRRNAAWALGELRNTASAAALLRATTDRSALVRGVARASLASLR